MPAVTGATGAIFHTLSRCCRFGMPAAIGAKLACPNKMVIDVDGDASWCMTGMELMTASQYGVNVKILLLNNNFQVSAVHHSSPLAFDLVASAK